MPVMEVRVGKRSWRTPSAQVVATWSDATSPGANSPRARNADGPGCARKRDRAGWPIRAYGLRARVSLTHCLVVSSIQITGTFVHLQHLLHRAHERRVETTLCHASRSSGGRAASIAEVLCGALNSKRLTAGDRRPVGVLVIDQQGLLWARLGGHLMTGVYNRLARPLQSTFVTRHQVGPDRTGRLFRMLLRARISIRRP